MFEYAWTVLIETIKVLARHRVRSALIVLGLAMGIAAFMCAVAVGEAGSVKVEKQLQNLGDNMIWIEAGSRSTNGVRLGSKQTKTLTVEDGRAVLEQVPFIRKLSPKIEDRTQVVYKNLNWGTTYRGVNPDYLDIRKWELQAGASFTEDDINQASSVCVLAQTVVENLFHNEDPIGATIRVNGMPCKVIGVLAPKGLSATGQDQDDFVVMPYTTVQKRISGIFWLDDMFASAVSREAMPEATRLITGILRDRHHLHAGEPDDFNVRAPEDLIRAQLQTSRILTLLLGTTASLALLVGGVGIMNIMLVSVTQRTREIGIRLAIGATEADVQMQFLVEAVLVSLLGGAAGIILGLLGSVLLRQTLHWEMHFSSETIMVASLFAAAVGIFFGYYPSKKASMLNPIESLRYEN